MVKGISRQVIVVQSPDKKLFEQAIFILRADAAQVTEDALLKEAKRVIRWPASEKKPRLRYYGPVWACAGALVTGFAWLLCSLF